MKQQGIIIVGAAGTLGSQFLSVSPSMAKTQSFLFDKMSDGSRNIKYCDLAAEKDINAALKSIPFEKSDYWRLLVASGMYDGKSGRTADWDKIRTSLEVNLIGVVQWSAEFAKALHKARKHGRIVIVSSAASHVGSSDLGYGVAKAGLCGLVRSISKQYAKDGISIIGVAPGIFLSAMSANQSEKRKRAAINQTHLGRALSLNEIVACTRFAVFDAPDALTGTFISPNGGQVLTI